MGGARRRRPVPAAWGRVARVVPNRPEDEEWIGEWYYMVERRHPDEPVRHGSASRPPDTVLLESEGGAPIATLDMAIFGVDNLFAYDREYYAALRVREILDADRWAALPGAPFGPGDLIFAWDQYHHLEYPRVPGVDPDFSYGGDWEDLSAVVDGELGAPPSRHTPLPPTPALLSRAIERDDVDAVRAMLAANVSTERRDPLMAGHAGVAIGASLLRSSSPLWDALNRPDPAILAAFLEAGVDPSMQSPGMMAPLHGAVRMGRVEHVRILLEAGADTSATFDGKTPLAMAREQGSIELVQLLEATEGRTD